MKDVRHWAIAGAIVLALIWSLVVLEGARAGLEITQTHIGETPVTRLSQTGAIGPHVVIAHGFAGSRQMMLAYGATLARAGYRVHIFDFEGHGRRPIPMSGDVTSIDGTTRLLIKQTRTVIADLPGTEPVALLGHSMATDVLVRAALEDPRSGPLVLLSAFSLAITHDAPDNALLISGAWEPGLRAFALDALRMTNASADEGDTVTGDVTRRAAVAPFAEHVAILHSRAGQAEALDWLNRFYARQGRTDVPPTGWAILALLASITVLLMRAARALPNRTPHQPALRWRETLLVAGLPMLTAPALAALVETRLLPVLVADYLMVHLAIYGAVQMAVLRWHGVTMERPSLFWGIGLALAALGTFGFALDRYAANFWPNAQRDWIILALLPGCVIFMLADSCVTYGASLAQRVLARVGFLLSLAIAVALDFEGLFFLIMIAPVIVLFFLTFGVMGRASAMRIGPSTSGVSLGLVLAWALGVSFPLFSA